MRNDMAKSREELMEVQADVCSDGATAARIVVIGRG